MNEVNESNPEEYKKVKKFSIFYFLGIVLEIGLCIISIGIFILTENVKNPITLVDDYSLYMFLLLVAIWVVDCACMEYRKKES